MNIKEGWWAAIIIGVALFAFCLGIIAGSATNANECRVLGKFMHDSKAYDCKPSVGDGR